MDGEELKKKTRIILVIVISAILVLSIFTILFTTLRSKNPFVTHDPIIIWTDEDYNFYNIPGEGTQDNPYIIENYNISTESGYGIFISDTTKYITIRNCYINAHYDGIHIENAAEKTILIENNKCEYSQNGIAIIGSYYAKVINNTCENNYQNGISLHHSDYSSTADNNCNFNGNAGISVLRTYFATICNNNCSGNDFSGIYSKYGYNFTISNNYCGSNEFGLSFSYSEIIQICNNRITENLIGINFQAIDNSTIWMNYFNENVQYAVEISIVSSDPGANCSYNVIYHNSFIDNNPRGFSQAYCDFANNSWYEITLMEGNFWNDWLGGTYIIESPILIEDLYPLTESPHER